MVEKPSEPEAQNQISLRNFLTYDHPDRENLQKLIELERQTNPGRLPQRFSDRWRDKFYDRYGADRGKRPSAWEKLGPFFEQKLKGDILIDLGGGDSRTIHEMADIVGVKTYINVDVGSDNDPYAGHPMPAENYWRLSNEQREIPMEAMDVYDDMLDFVSRLPDNSSNFILNGIDSYVLKNEEYRKALFKELVRATKEGGVLFGFESDIWQNDPRLKSVAEEFGLDTKSWGSSYAVFEKIKKK